MLFVSDPSELTREKCIWTVSLLIYISYLSGFDTDSIDDTCALYPPYHKTITLPTSLQLKLINHLTLRYPQATSVAEIRSVLPSVVEEWGSIQVLPAGDRIYASSLSRRTGDTRDATHVRVSCIFVNCIYRSLIDCMCISTNYLLTQIHDITTGQSLCWSRPSTVSFNMYTHLNWRILLAGSDKNKNAPTS